MKTLRQIWEHDSKLTAAEGATDMLESFAAKAAAAGHNKEEIIAAISQFFNQCREVAERKAKRGRELVIHQQTMELLSL